EPGRRHKAIEAPLLLHRGDPFVHREYCDPMALRLRAREGRVRGPRGFQVELRRADRPDHLGVEAEGLDEAHREAVAAHAVRAPMSIATLAREPVDPAFTCHARSRSSSHRSTSSIASASMTADGFVLRTRTMPSSTFSLGSSTKLMPGCLGLVRV